MHLLGVSGGVFFSILFAQILDFSGKYLLVSSNFTTNWTELVFVYNYSHLLSFDLLYFSSPFSGVSSPYIIILGINN